MDEHRAHYYQKARDRAWGDRRYRKTTIPLQTPEERAALDDFDSVLSRRIAFEKTMRHARRRIAVLFWF